MALLRGSPIQKDITVYTTRSTKALKKACQAEFNACTGWDMHTGQRLSAHRRYLQISMVSVLSDGVEMTDLMLFPRFLLPTLTTLKSRFSDRHNHRGRTSTNIDDYPLLNRACPYFSLLMNECERLRFTQCHRYLERIARVVTCHQLREQLALMIFYSLAQYGTISTCLHLSSNRYSELQGTINDWFLTHPVVSRLTDEYLFFAFYNTWTDCP